MYQRQTILGSKTVLSRRGKRARGEGRGGAIQDRHPPGGDRHGVSKRTVQTQREARPEETEALPAGACALYSLQTSLTAPFRPPLPVLFPGAHVLSV